MPSKKSNKESAEQTTSDKPKRTLNPIIKSMNDYRNNVISLHVGSKAPRKTSPIFKLTLAAARTEMGLDDKDKNTIEVVNKAQELFEANTSKYLKMAEVQEETTPAKKESAVSKKSKSTKKKSEDSDDEVIETKKKPVIKKKAAPKKQVEESDDSDDEVIETKKKPIIKKKTVSKKKIIEESDSDSESDFDSDSD